MYNKLKEKDSILVTLRAVSIEGRCIFSLYRIVLVTQLTRKKMKKYRGTLKHVDHHKTLNVIGEVTEDGTYEFTHPDNTTKFEDLTWIKDYIYAGPDNKLVSAMVRSYVFFDNGFHASLIAGTNAYGEPGQYECAVLDEDGHIVDDEGILHEWADPYGNLSIKELEKLLVKISKLIKQ